MTPVPGRRWRVGQSGKRVWIANSWRVLDVGSGHDPHPRADVLLEKYLDDDTNRAGARMDRSDPRLVEGDALNMPFPDDSFDYAIASHIAEHVDSPAQLFRELSRVSRAGYIETPGWLGDRILRESFHPWVIRKVDNGLQFTRVSSDRSQSWPFKLVYAAVYLGEPRPGHRVPVARRPLIRILTQLWRYAVVACFRTPVLVEAIYTRFEWQGEFPGRQSG